jgi:WD40 repeat protein
MKHLLPLLLAFPLLAKPVSYYNDIRPLFQARCHGCHQPAKDKGDYIMTDFAALLKGGDSEEVAIVPGAPKASHLVEMIIPNEDGEVEMPRGHNAKPLHEAEVEIISKWISEGAKDDTPDNARQLYSAKNPPSYTQPPVVADLAYSPDGALIAVTGFHEVLLHKADGSGLVKRLVGLSERVESVAFSPDGTRLAVGGGLPGRMGEIQVWDVEKGELQLSRPLTFDTLYGISWSPDGSLIAAGCADTSMRVIKAKNGDEVVYMAAHDDWVRDTVFSRDGKSVFSVGRDKTVKQTDVETQRFIGNLTTHTPGILRGGMNAIAVHPSRPEVLVGGADGKPKLFKQATQAAPAGGGNPNQIREYGVMPGRVFAVDISPDGKTAYAASSLDGKGQVRAYNTDGGKDKWTLDLPTGAFAIAVSPDGETLAASGYDGRIRLIGAADGKPAREFVPVELAPADAGTGSLVGAAWEPYENTQRPKDPKTQVASMAVQPSELAITEPNGYAQLLLSSDAGQDLTRLASWNVTGDIGVVNERGLFTPAKNGTGAITATFATHSVSVPVTVSGLDQTFAPDFISHVNPVISKLGCNAGTCHGAKDGKNGFKLSLRGYDPLFDIRGFTDDMASRRVNVAVPDKSLMLLKATGAVPHEGHQVTARDSRYYRIIRDWIAGGAKLDLASPRVTGIRLFPENPVIQAIGGAQQFRVLAEFADGAIRDVTRESFIDSSNTEVATHDKSGLLTSLRRGEAAVLARYEGRYAATTLTVMGDRSGFAWQEPPAFNKIDRLAAAKWQRMKIQPSELASDETFLRRAYLDLTGVPPTADAVRAFLATGSAGGPPAPTPSPQAKRAALIDSLIGSEPFVEHWTNKWADLLQVNRKFLGAEGAKTYRDWIRGEIAENRPYDQFVRRILTASGSNKANPAASYYKILRTPEDTMENTTHLFLATRFNCNKCHDHPFERWTQDQYYEMAAHFAQFSLEKDPAAGKNQIGKTAVEAGKPLYEIVSDKDKGDVKHERTGLVTPPAFPYAATFAKPEAPSRRATLAAWITAPDNQYFARSYVNRLWGYLFGKGIIEPIDDIRAGNPPSNPELLDYLTKEFVDSGFDVRHMLRLIANSRTYQLSVATNKWNADDDINFSHASPRRLPAEVLLDAVYTVTGATSKFPGVAQGTRAAALPDAGITLPDGFLGNFGRPARETSCECERSNELQLGPVMALVSGPTVNDAISDPSNAIAKLAQAEANDAKLIDELFIRVLNRAPTGPETQAAKTALADRIAKDHAWLEAELANAAKRLEPELAQKEAARQARIERAQAAIDAYQTEIAEREAKLATEQQARIAAAQKALADHDATAPERQKAWESQMAAGDFGWQAAVPTEASANYEGVTFAIEDDHSVFVSGASKKGAYTVLADSALDRITGLRLELLADKRLPGNGPGRHSNGNYVLSELTVTAEPLAPGPELKSWEAADLASWTPTGGLAGTAGGPPATRSYATPTSSTKADVTLSHWHMAGPFTGGNPFDNEYGPEKGPVDLAASYGEQKWAKRTDITDGQALALAGENRAWYFYRSITASAPRALPLSFGSDDGIRVWFNGKEIIKNNIGRGVAPDQEKATVNLETGANHLLVKIHNQGGPGGFYFKSDADAPTSPALIADVKAKAGTFTLIAEARVATAIDATLTIADSSTTVSVPASDDFQTITIPLVSSKDLTSLRLDLGPSFELRRLALHRNELPVDVPLQNALANYSQNSYDVPLAIDGKVDSKGWASAGDLGKDRLASFDTKTDIGFPGGTRLRVSLDHQYDDSHTIGRFRLSATGRPRPVRWGLPADITEIIAQPIADRPAESAKKLTEFFNTNDATRSELTAALTEAKAPRPIDPKLKSLQDAHAVASKPLPLAPELVRLRRAFDLSKKQLANQRIVAAQDIAWALINSPAFLFNH